MGVLCLLYPSTPLPPCSCGARAAAAAAAPSPFFSSAATVATTRLQLCSRSQRRAGVARVGGGGGGKGEGDKSGSAAFFDEDGVVDDMDGYLNYLSLEYDSVWDTKPAWCQPWTILLTGTIAVACSWVLIQSAVITAGVSFVIGAWWYIFLYSYPKIYLATSLTYAKGSNYSSSMPKLRMLSCLLASKLLLIVPYTEMPISQETGTLSVLPVPISSCSISVN